MGKDLLEIISKVIGYYYWNPKNNKEAERLGKDCAEEVRAALEREAPIIDEYIEVRRK